QLHNSAGISVANLQLQPDLHWQPDGLTLQLPLQAQLQNGQALQAGLPLQQASLQGTLSAALDAAGNWQLHSEQGLTSQLQLAALPGWQLPPLALTLLPQLAAEGNVYATQVGEQLRVAPLRLQLQPATLRQPANRHHAATELQLQASTLQCRPTPGWLTQPLRVESGVGAFQFSGLAHPGCATAGPSAMAPAGQATAVNRPAAAAGRPTTTATAPEPAP